MPGWIGPWELAILLVIVLLVFGPKRLPEMGRSLGKGMREFKRSITDKDHEDAADELEAGASEEGEDDPGVEDVAEELRVARREQMIDQALRDGRITAEEADDYRKLYDAEPESTTRLIDKLPAGAGSTSAPERDA